MKRSQILGAGLVAFLVGFIITISQVAQHHSGALTNVGAVILVLGVVIFFYYLLSTPKKIKK